MVAEPAASPQRHPRGNYRATWWTTRILDAARFEIALFQAGCPLTWHTVILDPDGTVSCTCPSGQEGFARTQRGWCNHVEALMRAALRAHQPLVLTPEILTYCPPCHGCRPPCRALIAHWSAAL